MSLPTKLSVANRALQHVGQKPLVALTDNSEAATAIDTCYDMIRRTELRRNVWRFAIRRTALRALTATTKVVSPSAWQDAPAEYNISSLVTYNGAIYISTTSANVGQNPETSNGWQLYYGPQTADDWTDEHTYYASELAIVPNGDVYISLVNNNDYSLAPDEWDDATSYSVGDRVFFDGAVYISYQDSNENNSPADIPDQWEIDANYDTPDQVTFLGNVYQASGPTIGDVPTDGAPWALVGASTWDFDPEWPTNWLFVSADLSAPFLPYAAGIGPVSDTSTGNIFYLPAGFLREAPQSPKAGSFSPLGAPAGLVVTDWLYENNMFVSATPGPIVLRFVADIRDPAQFDPMFVEGFAARIAFEVCEPLTQSNTKLANLAATYKSVMTEARMVNGIEVGPTEPPLDDLIACRV